MTLNQKQNLGNHTKLCREEKSDDREEVETVQRNLGKNKRKHQMFSSIN